MVRHSNNHNNLQTSQLTPCCIKQRESKRNPIDVHEDHPRRIDKLEDNQQEKYSRQSISLTTATATTTEISNDMTRTPYLFLLALAVLQATSAFLPTKHVVQKNNAHHILKTIVLQSSSSNGDDVSTVQILMSDTGGACVRV